MMHSSRQKRTRERGFTFVEVCLATAVLATAALIAFPTMLSFFELSKTARDENIATHDLAAAAEDILSTAFVDLPATYVDGQAIPKYAGLHLPNQQIVVNYDDAAADPLVITLAASWTDHRGRARGETLRCLRTQ